MRIAKKLAACVVALALSGSVAMADDHGRGHGHDKHDHDDDGRAYYSDQDRAGMRQWYHDRDDRGSLPPGLAKRDQLPPGLEKQLCVRGTLPPGLRKKMVPCPEEVERRLPPPPPGCEHTVIGGHVVLVNKSTYVVLDIIHFEQ